MSNLIIEQSKLKNKSYRAVIDIISNEYDDGHLEVHRGQSTLYAFFFKQCFKEE